MADLLTLGHSNHPIERFIALLKDAGATAVADVRSTPYSRFSPQYSKEPLRKALANAGIAYSFLGMEFGARSPDPGCYQNGRVQYSRLAQSEAFASGKARIEVGLKRFKIAFVCAERDPIECHRALLVARAFSECGNSIAHIHSNGTLENHPALENRLIGLLNLPLGDTANAYLIQCEKVGYFDKRMV